MEINIKLNTDNAAYEGLPASEIAIQVITHVKERIELGYAEGIVSDVNGNTTGKWNLTQDNF